MDTQDPQDLPQDPQSCASRPRLEGPDLARVMTRKAHLSRHLLSEVRHV